MKSRQAWWLRNVSQLLASLEGAAEDSAGSVVRAPPGIRTFRQPGEGRPPEGSYVQETLSAAGCLFQECSERERLASLSVAYQRGLSLGFGP